MQKKEKRVDSAKIAVVGGGISGASVALYLSEHGLDVALFEKGKSLVNGPPMCHLHAGGNLYREISDNQCITLLRQSIDLLRFYPFAIDYRPTVIAIPIDDKGKVEDLLPRLNRLTLEYETLIKKDPKNKVLGDSKNYFKIYSREMIEFLKKKESVEYPTHMDDWMISVAKHIDLEKIKFPLLMVQEYGLNIFRMASGITLALNQIKKCRLKLQCNVLDVVPCSQGWSVSYQHQDESQNVEYFDYLINAAGFRSGILDDLLGFKQERIVEFKAAYVTKWESTKTLWPEIIFHGERGTPKGMAQFTPYPDGHFQLHGMTKNITLFDKGLVGNTERSAYPKLPEKFIQKIDYKWSTEAITKRTHSAIEHIAQFVPSFKDAQVASRPLYGAQQIPGDNPDLRAADVSFEGERYARCEVVKASSVLDAIDEIVKQLVALNFLDASVYLNRGSLSLQSLNEEEIAHLAATLCRERGYPLSLAGRLRVKP